jgi:phosphoesterase RecJ-like protein
MESFTKSFTDLHRLIKKHNRFVLTSHIHTDGDAVGSLMALFYYLESAGKSVEILLPGDVPAKYSFLNTNQYVNRLPQPKRKSYIRDADVVIILDISALNRLGQLFPEIRKSRALKVCIDHHPFEKADWIDMDIIHTERVAAAELVYQFFKTNKIPINLDIAKALYTGILSDSGSFRFQRTDSFTFKMASDLVKSGIDPSEIYGYIYENGTQNQLRAWGSILSGMESMGDVAWLSVKKETLDAYNLTLEDFDGIIDILRKNRDALIVMVFVEKSANEVMVGLRSKNGFDVGDLARKFGGGGHFHAAGFTGFDRLEKVINNTVSMIDTIISEKKDKG